MNKQILFPALMLLSLVITSCQKSLAPVEVLKSFGLNSTSEILTQSGVILDTTTSTDGIGSIRIDATQPTVVKLFEVKDIAIEDAKLIYRSHIKTENIAGKVYLEMWCVFPGQGEFFSRSLQYPISGTVNWTAVETPFLLQKGQKPELVKLNLVIDGQGTVWLDEVSLIKGGL